MSARTGSLVKELAGLFVKYGLADWKPVIDELERGGRTSVASAVEELAKSAARRKPTKAKTKTKAASKGVGGSAKAAAAIAATLSPDRRELLQPVVDALSSKQIMPGVGDVRALFVALGVKGSPPTRRADGVNAIIGHLNAVEPDRIAAVVETIDREASRRQDPQSYQRWFDLIGARGLAGPRHGAAHG